MKKLYTLSIISILFCNANLNAQCSCTCGTALPIASANTCNFTSYTTSSSGNQMWFSFTAQSTDVSITLVNQNIFGINAPHIHNLALYGGTCSNLIPIADDELPFVNNADTLAIDLDASGLTIGATYYIRAMRTATVVGPCPRANCTASSSTAPSTFNLCVQNINVIIPKDFGLELPAISHAYYQNRGQLIDVNGNPRPDIKLYTINSSPAVYIANDFVSYVYASVDTIATTVDTLHRVDMTLAGANPTRTFKTEKIPGVLNYFLAHIPQGVTGNKGFSRAVQNDVYPNIDMQFYSNNSGIKFYFIVRPGGDADNIVMNFSGASSVNVTANKGLQISTPIGSMTFDPGHAYQVNPAGQIVPMPWQADFIQLSPTQVKLDIRNYPANMPLFIQVDRGHTAPTIAASDWSTYDGGNDYDEGTGVITDGSGNAYFCGVTGSSNFPNIVGGIFTSNTLGDRAAYINKYNPLGVPVWGTYYGGAGTDKAYDIDFNSLGDFYIVGYTTSSNLPQAANSIQGTEDGFIARFNNTATAILFAKYFGGTGGDEARGVAIDALNNVYIVGETTSGTGSNFPLVPKTGGYNQSSTTATSGYPDAFIGEFDASNTQIWGSYFGGDDFDNFTSIAIGANNSVLCAGSTLSATAATTNALNTPCGVPNSPSYFPDCDPGGNAYHRIWLTTALTGNHDAIIAEFNQNGALNWSTYFGGDGSETTNSGFLGYGSVKNAIAFNPNNNNIFYLAGRTQKFNNFPTQFTSSEYGQTSSFIGSSTRAFIGKFDTRVLKWATLYGAGPQTLGFDVTVDNDDNVYLTGMTQCTTYASVSCTPATNPNTEFPVCDVPGAFFQPTYGGGGGAWMDVFISAFNANNALIWSTLYGGSRGEEQRACTYDPIFSRLYLTGRTTSTGNFPLRDPQTGNYQQNNTGGGPNDMDAFIARFDVTPIISLSTEDLSEGLTDLNIFPNPATDNININIASKSAGDMTLNIYNTLGEQVFVRNDKIIPSDNYYSINVSSFSNGIYFIRVGFGKNFYCAKFIIQ